VTELILDESDRVLRKRQRLSRDPFCYDQWEHTTTREKPKTKINTTKVHKIAFAVFGRLE